MNMEDIKLKWKLININKEATINLWDEKASHFGNYDNLDMENDHFIKLLKNKKLINEKSNVLDVGCGGGKYTLALSKECAKIYGVDLSPKMIDYANKNKEKFNILNANFGCEDWHNINIKESFLYKNFDLVFASMTPAIQSYDTFEKLSECSTKYCVLRSNIKRQDSIYNKIKNLVNIPLKNCDLNFLYAFNTLYLQGYTPIIDYENKTWTYKEPLEKSCNIYINKIKEIKDIDKEYENKIKKFLTDISEDGYVHEEINSTIATLIWNVEEGGK